jgi:hypothetical protein
LRNDRTIERIYQGAKRDEDGQPFTQPKGKKPSFLFLNGELHPCTNRLRQEFYLMLWYIYFIEHPELLDVADQYNQFRDIFSEKGVVVTVFEEYPFEGNDCNQARAIAYCVQLMRVNDGLFTPEWITQEVVRKALEKYNLLFSPIRK